MENQHDKNPVAHSSPSLGTPGANPPAPALNPAHQHHDAHHVHQVMNDEKPIEDGAAAERGTSNTSGRITSSTEKPVVETTGDVESAQTSSEGGRRTIWSRYKKEIRLAVNLGIWLIFTG